MARPADTTAIVQRVLKDLRACGVLLQSDSQLPNVASIVAGQPIVGSWWSHPDASAVHWVLEELEDEPEVLQAKLINGKVTLIHRDLWPSLLAVATCAEPWQTRGLSELAASLLRRVRRAGRIRTDQLRRWNSPVTPGVAARELEKRLLVYSQEIHTDSGRHAKCVETWQNLMSRQRLSRKLPSPADAKLVLEGTLSDARVRLPWR